MIEAVVFDFGRTLFDPTTNSLFPETHPTLQLLREKAIRLGLVTVALTDDTKIRIKELDTLGIKDYFDEIEVIGRSSGKKNFTRILGEFNLQNTPQYCAIVGDNLKREITEGNIIGAYTIWTKQKLSSDWEPQSPHEIPRATIRSLSELIPLIEKHNS